MCLSEAHHWEQHGMGTVSIAREKAKGHDVLTFVQLSQPSRHTDEETSSKLNHDE